MLIFRTFFCFVLFFAVGAGGYIDFDMDTGRSAHADPQDVRDYQFAMRENNLFTVQAISPIKPFELIACFRSLCDEDVPRMQPMTGKSRIPRIIHQIWLGGVFPDLYKSWRQSWLDIHPEWTYILWTDNSKNYDQGIFLSNIEELEKMLREKDCAGKMFVINIDSLNIVNKELFDRAPNYGAKASIFRYEVLYNYGGVYIDTDLECFRSFDPLVCNCDFFAGMAPINMRKLQVANGLMGSIPGHPILLYCIECPGDYDAYPRLGKEQSTVAATGPGLLTRAIFYKGGKGGTKDIVLASSYFYALRRPMLKLIQSKNESFPPKQFSDLANEQFKVSSDAFAIHYWETSWMK